MTLRDLKDSTEVLLMAVVQAQAQGVPVVTRTEMTVIQLIFSAFAIASTAGFARLLHSRRVMSYRTVAAAILYPGICGVISVLLMANYGSNDNPYLTLGVAGLVGIGGLTVMDIFSAVTRSGGFSVELKSSKDNLDKREDL